MKEVKLEASKPDRGAFVKFDSEKQSDVRFVVDGSQWREVQKLNELEYGETFEIIIRLNKESYAKDNLTTDMEL